MDFLLAAIDIVLHLEHYLDQWIPQLGAGTVIIVLALVIFAETGLVVTPFLPGDSLLFTIGALCARDLLPLTQVMIVLSVAAILGDTLNYSVGKFLGHWVAQKFSRVVKPEYLAKTHEFYEKYGGKTIVIARFVPIVRTLAPFVAGVGEMGYRSFAVYNIVGGIGWILSMTLAGFFFGNLEFVKKHFSLVVVGIVILSVLPMLIELYRHRRDFKRA